MAVARIQDIVKLVLISFFVAGFIITEARSPLPDDQDVVDPIDLTDVTSGDNVTDIRPSNVTTEEPTPEDPTAYLTHVTSLLSHLMEPPGCKDINEQCLDWANKGECSKNPDYMNGHCKKSCKQCITGYDKRVRPVQREDDNITIQFSLKLLSIDDVDMKRDTFSARYVVLYEWKDFRLAWSPAEYGHLVTVDIDGDKIWKPYLSVFNSVGDTKVVDTGDAIVINNGHIMLMATHLFVTHCSYDLTRFPYDTQTCRMQLGFFFHRPGPVELKLGFANTWGYHRSSQWNVVDFNSAVKTEYWINTPMPTLHFNITIARNSGAYTQLFVLPAAILSCLVPTMFLLPLQGTHRYILGGTVLICLTLLGSTLEWVGPGIHGTTPLLGQYFVGLQVIVVLCLLAACLINNLAASDSIPPYVLKKHLIQNLGGLLRVKRSLQTGGGGDSDDTDLDGVTTQVSKDSDWMLMARVIDRLLFLVFLALLLLVIIAFAIH